LGKEDRCKYRRIWAKKNIHIYIDDKIYRELKLIHSNLNYYSIAILVRNMIEKFFTWFNENNNEEDVVREVEKIKKEMRDKSEVTGYEIVKVKKKVGQLCQNSIQKFISVDYMESFSIFSLKIFNPDLIFS